METDNLSGRKLDTKGCCFLCLKVLNIKIEGEKNTDEVIGKQDEGSIFKSSTEVSLKSLRRYLKIDTESLPGISAGVNQSVIGGGDNDNIAMPLLKKEEDIVVELCKSCAKIIKKFSKFFAKLEMVQSKVNYWLDQIHQQIPDNSNDPELVEIYTRRMKSGAGNVNDEDSDLSVFVDALRMEINKKCATVKSKLEAPPSDLSFSIIKEEPNSQSNVEETEEAEESEYFLFSPLGSGDEEEEDKAEMDIDIDLTKNEDCSFSNAHSPSTSAAPSAFLSSLLSPEEEDQANSKIEKEVPRSEMYFRSSETKKYHCTACTTKNNSSTHAFLHYESVHLKKKSKCDFCGILCSSKSTLQRHQLTCTEEKPKPPKKSTGVYNTTTGTYNCSACDKNFTSQSGCYAHYRLRHLKRSHRCDICKVAVFPYYTKLHQHKKLCKKVKVETGLEGNGEALSVSADGDDNDKVATTSSADDLPPFTFKVTSTVPNAENFPTSEMYVRNKETRSYDCRACEKVFRDSGTARQHYESIHLQLKYQCDYCEVKTSQKSSLRRHWRLCVRKRQAQEGSQDT